MSFDQLEEEGFYCAGVYRMDKAGKEAWEKYKEKLIKENKMANKNETKKRKSVDLYDPRFVHFDWNESLEGKKGFAAGTMSGIKKLVRNEGPDKRDLVTGYYNEAYPFTTRPLGEKGEYLRQFFYYDPNYEIKWAYFVENKRIQFRRSGFEENWIDLLNDDEAIGGARDPANFDDYKFKYRIKPEEESKKEPTLDVNIDVNIKSTSNPGSIKITINGKECIFESIEQARAVLKED